MSQREQSDKGHCLTLESIEAFYREYHVPVQPNDPPWVAQENAVLFAMCEAAKSTLSSIGRNTDRMRAELACEYSKCVSHDLTKARCDHCPIDALTKPVSPTPRTDAVLRDCVSTHGPLEDHARQLERELAEADEWTRKWKEAAMQSIPSASASSISAALQRLCDLKRMKVALERQIGDDLALPGGVVKRADIQRYYDENKEPAWQQAFDACNDIQNEGQKP
jgi:hypothetical protein